MKTSIQRSPVFQRHTIAVFETIAEHTDPIDQIPNTITKNSHHTNDSDQNGADQAARRYRGSFFDGGALK